MKIVSKNIKSEFTTEKSKFISYIYFVSSREEVDYYLDGLQREHRKARHIVYAYRIGYEKMEEHYTDDGEPSLTAGLPVYNVLKTNHITFVLLAVVRYFGGVKLGTGGLKRAYEKGASEVLSSSKLQNIKKYEKVSIKFDYKYMKLIENILYNNIIFDREFSELVKLSFYMDDEKIVSNIIESTNDNVEIEYEGDEIVNTNTNKKISYNEM